MTPALKSVLKHSALSATTAVLLLATSELSAAPTLQSLVMGPAPCGAEFVISGSDFNQYVSPVVTLTDTVNNVVYQPTINWRTDTEIAIQLPKASAVFQVDIEDQVRHWLVLPRFQQIWISYGVFSLPRWQLVPGTGTYTYHELTGLLVVTCP